MKKLFLFKLIFLLIPFWANNQTIANLALHLEANANKYIVLADEADKPFQLQLLHAGQYMQSVQLVFELTNKSTEHLNHFWLHVSLRNRQGGFLYREQPALFAGIGSGQSQIIEMLCESVGIEEVGYIILHPRLLEINRFEQAFDTTKVSLQQPENLSFKMIFAGQNR